MREARAVRQIQAIGSTSKKTPLAEHIQHPLDDEGIVASWKRLAESGKTDWKIANIIANEYNVSPRSIEGKIRRLRNAGLVGENPNKKEKRFKLREFVMESRESLMAQGMCDGTIAREIAEVTGADVASLKTTISAMVKKEEIPRNPNNQVKARPEEFKWVRTRRKELQNLGLTDTSISRVVAAESELRNDEAVRRILWEMVGDGLLERNEKVGWKEMEEIILRRYELIEHGMDDHEIAIQIGKEFERKQPTISLLIYRAVHNGGCKKNPN